MTSAGHLSLYPWLLKFTELHRVYFLLLYFVPLDATCFGEKRKKKKDGQTDWLTSRRGLKKYLCVTIFSHFSAVIMRICLRYPFLRILETNTWERWVNPIKPVIEKSIDNFQKWGNVKEQKGKKNLQSQWANLPLIGIRS